MRDFSYKWQPVLVTTIPSFGLWINQTHLTPGWNFRLSSLIRLAAGDADSSFVEVEFKAQNNSTGNTINEYEIYFDEVADTALYPGENNIRSFKKFVRNTTVDSVVVSSKWVKPN